MVLPTATTAVPCGDQPCLSAGGCPRGGGNDLSQSIASLVLRMNKFVSASVARWGTNDEGKRGEPPAGDRRLQRGFVTWGPRRERDGRSVVPAFHSAVRRRSWIERTGG
jgi:hypothetical protein